MAAVLPFDPALRRRTPPAPRRTVPAAGGAVSTPVTPLPTRAARAVAAPARRSALTLSADEVALARRFFPLLLLVALLDLATKAWATTALAGLAPIEAGPFALHLVRNTASAGGVWLGTYTRELNFAATGIVVGLLVMLVPALARLDRHAPTALALVAGGGLGNLVSLGASAAGVPDFLAIRHGSGAWILNVADVAMVIGLAMLARTVVLIARAAAAEARRGRPRGRSVARPAGRRA